MRGVENRPRNSVDLHGQAGVELQIAIMCERVPKLTQKLGRLASATVAAWLRLRFRGLNSNRGPQAEVELQIAPKCDKGQKGQS